MIKHSLEKQIKSHVKNHTQKQKVVFLDVNGVVYRNNKVLNNIRQNIVQYCAKELNTSLTQARKINHILHAEYGHTYKGLKEIYDIDKTLLHFNTEVYNSTLFNDVYKVQDDVYDHMHFQILKDTIRKCELSDIPVYLFTNAPMIWCHHILNVSGLNQYIPETNIISCDHHIMTYYKEDGLKPLNDIYATLQQYIEHKYHLYEPLFIIVDDSLKNLTPIINLSSWIPIYYNEKAHLQDPHKIIHISTAMEYKMFINKII